jgi:hypothetical protein
MPCVVSYEAARGDVPPPSRPPPLAGPWPPPLLSSEQWRRPWWRLERQPFASFLAHPFAISPSPSSSCSRWFAPRSVALDAGSDISSLGYGASDQIWSSGARTRGGARVFVVARLLEQAVVRVKAIVSPGLQLSTSSACEPARDCVACGCRPRRRRPAR